MTRNDTEKAWGFRLTRELEILPVLQQIFDAVFRSAGELAPVASEAFAPSVDSGAGDKKERSEFLRLLAEKRREAAEQRQTVEAVRLVSEARGSIEFSPFRFTFESYTDPPGAEPAGAWHSLLWRGTVPDGPLQNFLSVWSHEVTPLFTAKLKSLAPAEAEAWLRFFLHILSSEDCPDLESYFLPTMLQEDSSDPDYSRPVSRMIVVTAFRASRAAWTTLTLAPVANTGTRFLSGGRCELSCNLFQSGTRRDGSRARSEQLHWQIEVVFTDERWQILRLRM